MDKPKPCPFCDNQPDLDISPDKYWYECYCGYSGPWAYTAADALADWNAIPRAAPEYVRELEDSLRRTAVPMVMGQGYKIFDCRLCGKDSEEGPDSIDHTPDCLITRIHARREEEPHD